MTKNIICIGGIHGVGKSTFCNEVIKGTTLKYVSASQIIKEGSSDINTSKMVFDISLNQRKLISGLDKKITDENWYILDSHFTLLNQVNQIEEIPFSFFETINPAAIIVLYDDPINIRNRWMNRDHIDVNLELINKFQKMELSYAKSVSINLKNSFLKIDISKDNATSIFHEFTNSRFFN